MGVALRGLARRGRQRAPRRVRGGQVQGRRLKGAGRRGAHCGEGRARELAAARLLWEERLRTKILRMTRGAGGASLEGAPSAGTWGRAARGDEPRPHRGRDGRRVRGAARSGRARRGVTSGPAQTRGGPGGEGVGPACAPPAASHTRTERATPPAASREPPAENASARTAGPCRGRRERGGQGGERAAPRAPGARARNLELRPKPEPGAAPRARSREAGARARLGTGLVARQGAAERARGRVPHQHRAVLPRRRQRVTCRAAPPALQPLYFTIPISAPRTERLRRRRAPPHAGAIRRGRARVRRAAARALRREGEGEDVCLALQPPADLHACRTRGRRPASAPPGPPRSGRGRASGAAARAPRRGRGGSRPGRGAPRRGARLRWRAPPELSPERSGIRTARGSRQATRARRERARGARGAGRAPCRRQRRRCAGPAGGGGGADQDARGRLGVVGGRLVGLGEAPRRRRRSPATCLGTRCST